MNKILKLLFSFALVVSLIPKSEVSALNTEELIEDELKVAIISGDGSEENPYVVDYEKAPHFKEYMNTINDKIMDELQGTVENDGILLCGIYDGILKGSKYTGQTKGGQWKYTSGKPSVSINGNIWMKKIVYVSITNTKNIRNLLKSDTALEIFDECVGSIKDKAYDAALEYLVKKGLGEAMGKSVLIGLGKLNSFFTAVEFAKFANDLLVLSRYNTAVNNGYGMINAIYATSYNGSWYAQYGEDSWTTASTVYLPSSAYGTGTYTAFTQ